MRGWSRYFAILGVTIGFVAGIAAQTPRFYMQADRNQVEEGETFVLEVVLENMNTEHIEMPDVAPFKIVGGPSTSTSMSIINGKRTSSASYRYYVMATKKGTYSIPPASSQIGGRTIKTNEVKIEVTDAKAPVAADANLSDDINLRLVASSRDGYIGQQIVLDYVIYTRQNISSYGFLNELKPDGFFIQPINNLRESATRSTINGKDYYTQVIARYILFPQKAGMFTLEPVKMRVDIPMDNGRSGFFFRDTRSINIQSNEVKIKISSLPEPTPVSFSGAVGKLNMKAVVQKSKVAVGQSVVMTMELEGYVDPKTVLAPKIEVPEGLEEYDPSVTHDETIEQNNGILVKKTFEYVFVPKKDTIFNIQPKVSYFDPEKGSYEIADGQPFVIHVVKGEGTVYDQQKESDITGLISQDTHLYTKIPAMPYWPLQAGGVLTIALLTMGGIYVKRNQIQSAEKQNIRFQAAASVAQRHLNKATEYITSGQKAAFYEEIAAATTGYVIKKFKIPHIDASASKIKEWLKEHDIPEVLVEQYNQIHHQAELARFAGQFGDMPSILEKAESFINGIESLTGKA
ncbi:MAG: protein BatD [Saprospiraceae bacterium]|nr:MAG: aerotolerance-related exported protein [Bacteroidetes bacterium OLB9]MCO6464331.1 protein BatD [Saprospiraceae bacterium]MCZ2338310.1 BatD family protein [Chitinophagales bacterium]